MFRLYETAIIRHHVSEIYIKRKSYSCIYAFNSKNLFRPYIKYMYMSRLGSIFIKYMNKYM
jgi:hypothetical protein